MKRFLVVALIAMLILPMLSQTTALFEPSTPDNQYTYTVNVNIPVDGPPFYYYVFSDDPGDVTVTGCTSTPSAIPTPTATPIPTPTATPTPLPDNQWGRALSNTVMIQDFNDVMDAEGGIDFSPYEIATPSLDLPALSLGVADMSIMAKTAATLWSMVDNLGVLPFYMLIAIAVALVFWLYRFVTDLPTPTPDWDISGAMGAYTGYDDMMADDIIGDERDIQRAIDARGGRDSDIGQSIYDDSLARLESAQERKERNKNRRSAVRGGVKTTNRIKKLF